MANNNYIIAIDLGTSNVVVAAGTPSDDGKISVEAVAVRESKGVVRGEVKNVEQAAQSIREAVGEIEEKLGITVQEAFTGISGSHIKCAKHPYYVYVSGADGEIFEEDVRRLNDSMTGVQAPDGYSLMHIIPQHYIVDDEEEAPDPVGMFGKTLGSTFNLIIGENTIMSRLEKALQKIGIQQKKLYINPLAAADAVTFPDEKDLGVAVVDIGAGVSDVCIYQDGIVRYVGVIPLGSDSINKDIRSYGIMERYVEELKIKYGCAVPSAVDGEKLVKVPGRTPHDHKEISFRNLASIIEARMLDIADYVAEEIKAAGYEGRLTAGIILTGGSAMLREIKTLMAQRTGMDVRIALPDINVTDQTKENASDPRFSAAVGILSIAMREGGSVAVGAGRRPAKPATSPVHESARPAERQPAADAAAQVPQAPRPPLPDPDFEYDTTRRSGDRDGDEATRGGAKKKGLFQKLKEKFEKTFDFDVLDDDNSI
ncbi:MAG: cell division protein FtsA [Rikenellaceae bacterium]|nr:cell division protein FtsA [Rikenellaceae bacterium]